MKNTKSNVRKKQKREKSRLEQSVQSEHPVQVAPIEQPEKEEEEEDFTPPAKRNIKSADITKSNILSSSSKRKKNIKK